MVLVSSHGEIADFRDVDQFQPGKSEYECGFFAVAIVKAMNEVGKPPVQSLAAMISEAEAWYAQYNGDNSSSNDAGMTLQQLYNLIVQVGLHFQAIEIEMNLIRAWIRTGYPVIVAGAETGMYDLDLNDVIPYPWQPAGNHIIVITGVTENGNLLVRDPANCTNLFDPNSLRPGPRVYDANRMQLISATVVVPPWLPRPPANFDPRKEPFMPTIPQGWQDNGTVLTAPNGRKVVRGFRKYVLSHNWDPLNMPLEEEIGMSPLEESNPSLGPGTQQVFNWITLEWTPSRGVFVAWAGQELMKVRADKAALLVQIADLEAKLKTFQQQTTPPTSSTPSS